MALAVPELPVLARDQAFESLYRRYVKDVYHYALAVLRNPADAEDVTQTTFLNAYRAYQRGIDVEKPQNWLIKIAHNVARTRYSRTSRRVKEVPLEDHIDQLAVSEAEQPDVAGVLQALGRLPFNQRSALVMRELEGRSYAEIAETIGVSVSAVEALIFRARTSLRVKASSLRVLAAVPLPGSLAQLFEGGGLVAGGGAAVGTGFLVKAAVALVAGAVATGIGGGSQGGSAAAAAQPPAQLSGAAWHGGAGVSVRARTNSLSFTSEGAWVAVAEGFRQGPVIAAVAKRAAEDASRRTHAPAGSAGSDASSPNTAPRLPDPIARLAITVEKAEAISVAALPVQAPNLPPLHVDAPKIVEGPPLP
jgi:RNA polymerase sigma factor (sigma-70 family)